MWRYRWWLSIFFSLFILELREGVECHNHPVNLTIGFKIVWSYCSEALRVLKKLHNCAIYIFKICNWIHILNNGFMAYVLIRANTAVGYSFLPLLKYTLGFTFQTVFCVCVNINMKINNNLDYSLSLSFFLFLINVSCQIIDNKCTLG